MDFSSINIWSVLVAALASFAIGSLWYSPLMFGKTWQNEVGLSDEDIKDSNMLVVFGSSFVLMLIMVLGLAFTYTAHGAEDLNWRGGLLHALFFGIVFIATSMGVNYLYQRKSIKLWLIDAGYQVFYLSIAGAIIGAW